MPFLTTEMADVVCVQECTQPIQNALEDLGYHTHFGTTVLHDKDGKVVPAGNLFASLIPAVVYTQYYYEPAEELTAFDPSRVRESFKQGLINATLVIDGTEYTIITTHFTWTLDGSAPSKNQKDDLDALLKYTEKLPEHILVGDFNIPRLHNPLYKKLTDVYTDQIPKEFKSSLDKDLHRVGNDPEKSILFTDYMVDYLFTKGTYTAPHVELIFGVSDHAAIVATIHKEN